MALKLDFFPVYENITHYCDTVCERGGIATLATAGSGVSLDGARNVVAYDAYGSGKKPIGILEHDVVNKDLTHNWLVGTLGEVQVGSKVTLLGVGRVTTNFVYPGITVSPGDPAYVAHSGYISNTRVNGGWSLVGMFETSKDQNGYATVFINVPNAG